MEVASADAQAQARERLDAHVRDMMEWHFSPETGTPFWLDFASKLDFDPRSDVACYADLRKFPPFEDEWLRGGPVRRWVPKAMADDPIYVFETGGTTGIPKSRVALNDFRTDYELFSASLPDEHFPPGSNWLMLGPSGPRRLRLAVEHLCQYRGGICFCVDLDPRWVIKLIKKGWMEHLEAYKDHVIDQALTVLSAGHDIQAMFATPKLLESLCLALEDRGQTLADTGIKGIFSGGTEFTPQWTRFAVEELLDGVYMTPTYGNTLMGLAASRPVTAADGYTIAYYAPQPRAVLEVVDPDDPDQVVDCGATGRVRLTTLTREFFVPGFLERDEGEREQPYVDYPWDGVSGVRPCRCGVPQRLAVLDLDPLEMRRVAQEVVHPPELVLPELHHPLVRRVVGFAPAVEHLALRGEHLSEVAPHQDDPVVQVRRQVLEQERDDLDRAAA